MPCYRCAARQHDPVKGPSDWKRGVLDGEQVLVCPSCQRTHDWQADLDRCPECGSTMLVRALGDTRCKACGATAAGESGPGVADESLTADVEAALRRQFGSDED
jgi:ribosomal protein L37AE/L43A